MHCVPYFPTCSVCVSHLDLIAIKISLPFSLSHVQLGEEIMLRKLYLKFNGKGKEGVNGLSNGQTDGSGREQLGRKRSSYMTQSKRKEKEEHIDHSASRADVESSFNKFAQLVHASRRPLPTQSGDGAYLDHTEPTGLMQDLKNIGFKDVETLMEVIKTKASGQLQNDKNYMMERVIQVR